MQFVEVHTWPTSDGTQAALAILAKTADQNASRSMGVDGIRKAIKGAHVASENLRKPQIAAAIAARSPSPESDVDGAPGHQRYPC